MAARRVVVVAFGDVQILDVTGPCEVFSIATRLLGSPDGYAVDLVAGQAGAVTASCGLAMVAGSVRSARGPIDTLVVPGGLGTGAVVQNEQMVRWVRAAAARSRRVVSVCTGALVLAEAGLLDGRRATTHWSACAALARRYPAVTVDPDRIFVRDGPVTTSAGVTAGMDLALALVEEDHGAELALEVARWLVVFLKRPGGQSQFSGQLAAQIAARPSLRDLQHWIEANLAVDLSVPSLARRAGMSPRNFARAFRREVGVTPGDYVEELRVAAARQWLQATDEAVARVATACGFGTVETMYRSFQRRLHVSPGDYRARFRSLPLPAT
jgi:transcriptional regulator GlxA family with amidase domain